jgi:hypothetical protein
MRAWAAWLLGAAWLLAPVTLCSCSGDPPDPGAATTLTVGRIAGNRPVDARAWMAESSAFLEPELAEGNPPRYRIVEAVPYDHLTLAAEPRRRDRTLAFSTIVVRDIPDPLSGGLALYKRDIDVLTNPGPLELDYVRHISGAAVYQGPSGAYAVRGGLSALSTDAAGRLELYALRPVAP